MQAVSSVGFDQELLAVWETGEAADEIVDTTRRESYTSAMNLKFLPGKELPPDTPLWRYMSLGAFFLLLKGNKVFVPSLKKLQEADPKEMRLPLHSDTDSEQLGRLPVFRDARDWLKTKLLCRTGSDRHPDPDQKEPRLEELIEEWIRQLRIRRLAWCWFCPSKAPEHWYESMAMWKLYAKNGIAIKTTLQNIRQAFQEPGLTEVLVAEVKYRIPRAPNMLPFEQAQTLCLAQAQAQAEAYATRPFLFKSVSYRYENEVRLVFQVNADVPESGFTVNVDSETLLKGGEVIISPFLFPGEQRAVIEVAERLLPEGTATFRPSSELAADLDTHIFLDERDELAQLSQPFLQEKDLPSLLGEL